TLLLSPPVVVLAPPCTSLISACVSSCCACATSPKVRPALMIPAVIRFLVTAGIISAGLTFGVVAQAAHEETQVEMKDVPEAAQTTIKEKAGNDQILRIDKETGKDKEVYDAIVSKDGRVTDFQSDSEGDDVI